MSRVERVGDLDARSLSALSRGRFLLEAVGQRLTVEKLHDQVVSAVH